MFSEYDHFWMLRAIQLAKQAAQLNEVPVGAVIVLDNQVIGEGGNRSILQKDPTAHAEILALRRAAQKIGNYRLLNSTLYVTLEPCLMCAGAMVHSRIKRLVHGAKDDKAGAIISRERLLDKAYLNHRVDYASGLLSEQCSQLLSDFFQMRR